MNYRRLFDPKGENSKNAENKEDLRPQEDSGQYHAGDRRDGMLYLYNDDTILAVNVALATGRPLLVTGPPGCGKSSLAFHVARVLKRRYYEVVVTARTQGQDLTWRFDSVRRLGDAQVGKFKDLQELDYGKTIYPYIEPRELWWIFNPESAANRGRAEVPDDEKAEDLAEWYPEIENSAQSETAVSKGSVLLIDEIDKADPDVPNSLLVALGSMKFYVDIIDLSVEFDGNKSNANERPLVIITTNRERPLPKPFLRRCIVLKLEAPNEDRLVEIAKANFGNDDEAQYRQVYKILSPNKVQSGERSGQETAISTAEFIDTVAAFRTLLTDSDEVNNKLLAEIVGKTGARWKKVEGG